MREYTTAAGVQPSQDVMPVTGDSTPPRSWLEQWPAARRSLLANLFHAAVRSGQHTPALVVTAVQAAVCRRLRSAMPPPGAREETLHAVWRAMQTAPQDAYSYAQTVLDREALPSEERQRQKQARAVDHMRAHMAQLRVTDSQLRYLQVLGHSGTIPANRAEASTLIDGLLSTRGKGR